MSMGLCTFTVCDSMLGTSFRALFHLASGEKHSTEVLLCPEHERWCDELKEKMPTQLMMTPEGWIYPRFWIETMAN